jgi:hypothetical protein
MMYMYLHTYVLTCWHARWLPTYGSTEPRPGSGLGIEQKHTYFFLCGLHGLEAEVWRGALLDDIDEDMDSVEDTNLSRVFNLHSTPSFPKIKHCLDGRSPSTPYLETRFLTKMQPGLAGYLCTHVRACEASFLHFHARPLTRVL